MLRIVAPRYLFFGVLLAIQVFSPETSFSATTFDSLFFSSDISVVFDGVSLEDENLARSDDGAPISLVSLPSVPRRVDLTAFHYIAADEFLLVFDSVTALPGSVTAQGNDIVRLQAGVYSIVLSGSAIGIPASAKIDAVSRDLDGNYVFSLDTTVELAGTTYDDEDLLQFNGSTASLVFDGSANGVASTNNIDAVHALSNGNFLISFSESGVVSAIPFSDEDILEFNPLSMTWELVYDGSALEAEWPIADLDAVAVIEPDFDNDGIPDAGDPDDDNDGLSDVDEGTIGSDPNDSDSDDDGVNDGTEVADGTDPLDPGSILEKFGGEVCVEWNGFLDFLTQIFELRNTSMSTIVVNVTLFDILGNAQDVISFSLDPGIQRDVIINDLNGFTENTFGLVCAEIQSGPVESLGGQLVTYRLTASSYTLAFTSEFLPARPGRQYYTYNTFQPSLDPNDASNFVANWVQLVNDETTGQSGTLRYYDFEGNEVRTLSVSIGPRERRDIDIHTLGPSLSGLICWEPDSATARFRLRQNRYYYGPTGLADLVEAVSLPAKRGTGAKLTAVFDTRQRTAALEISNTSSSAITVTTDVYDQFGNLTASQPPLLGIPPKGTRGLVLNEYLAAGLGNVQIDSDTVGSMIVNIVEYGRSGDGSLLFGNPSSPRETLGSSLSNSYNSFLNQQCRLRVASDSAVAESANVTMTRFDGTVVLNMEGISVPANGALELDLCSNETLQAYGETLLEATTAGVLAAEVVRQNAEGTIEFSGSLKP